MIALFPKKQPDKLEEIYRRYYKLLFYIADGILNDPAEAEDAVHDAFLKIAAALDRLPAADDPRTRAFAAAIVRNRAIDLYRKRQNLLPLDESILPAAPPQGSAERLLEGMPEPHRTVLLLRYDMGFSVREVAALTDRSPDSIYKIIQAAKKQLAESLKKEGISWN